METTFSGSRPSLLSLTSPSAANPMFALEERELRNPFVGEDGLGFSCIA